VKEVEVVARESECRRVMDGEVEDGVIDGDVSDEQWLRGTC
jgi:hypothetical protein